MTKEQYVDFETAKLLKEKGFDWECDSWAAEYITGVELHTGMERRNYNDGSVSLYDGLFSAPTQQMACRWLREEHGIDIIPIIRHSLKSAQGSPFRDYACRVYDRDGNIVLSATKWYSRYESAIEAALEYALKNLI